MRFNEAPGYDSLYDEIVKRDSYKLQSLVFRPDVIFDIGANIGVFTHYAKQRFPESLVVAVEPHPPNFEILSEFLPAGCVALNKAIGQGQILRYPDVQYQTDHVSAGESYVSDGLGYHLPNVGEHPLNPVATAGVLLDELYAEFVKPGQTFAIKMDCEGAENLLFEHPPSVEVFQKADFLTMELHPFWTTKYADAWREPNKRIAQCMTSFVRDTHRYDSEIPYFFAWRKPDDEPICAREQFGELLRERGLLGNVAEIGVCTGSYSRDILNWGVKHITLVDIWKELPDAPCGISDEQHEAYYQECLEHIKGCEDRVTILRMLSTEAAELVQDESLSFCYIDCNHRYEDISVDLPTWWPKVKPGGILAGHDFLAMELGVNRAVKEFAAKHGLKVHLVVEHQQDASFYLEKPNDRL